MTEHYYYTIKFRLYPNREQFELFYKTSGSCRFLYNKCLAHKIRMYDKKGINLSKYYFMKQLTKLKKMDKYEWLKEVSAQALQQSIIDLFKAYDNFFKHGSGFPNFKKFRDKRSFRLPQSCSVDLDSRKLLLGKLGWCKARGSFDLYHNEKVNSITVSQDSDNNWYASVLIERDTRIKDHQHPYVACGNDLGVAVPLTTVYADHNGKYIHNFGGHIFSKELLKKEKRRNRYQKSYSRKQKGSNNQEKARLKLAKAFYKEKQCRKNFSEQTSVRLARLFQFVIYEGLNMKNMTRSAKGTIEEPGTNVKAKSRLNLAMRRLGLSQLVIKTNQKCRKYGGSVLYVDPKRTSQECSECDYTHKKNRISRDLFHCQNCSHQEHADVNAGKNILKRGWSQIRQEFTATWDMGTTVDANNNVARRAA
jgi:putative transposase